MQAKGVRQLALMNIEHLSYKAGNKSLLNDISWQVEAGENWCVFGLNGSGKTTLLSIAAGYLPAAQGTVSLLGETLNADNRQRLCAQTGLVSDAFFARYYRWEAVLDVTLSGYGGRLGLSGGLDDKKINCAKRLLWALGLAKLSRKPFVLLSKGEQQKVLLARALLARPQILFLDEPCSGLDVLSRLRMLSLFRQLAKEAQITLVCVTHHFDEILEIYDRALLLKQGEVHSLGPQRAIFSTDNMSSFFGQPVTVTRTAEGMLEMILREEPPSFALDMHKQGGEKGGIPS